MNDVQLTIVQLMMIQYTINSSRPSISNYTPGININYQTPRNGYITKRIPLNQTIPLPDPILILIPSRITDHRYNYTPPPDTLYVAQTIPAHDAHETRGCN